ncbi:MAG: hypothetical protein IJ364_02350, partial [Oscillospiraceae bacterium]|nr:hypothetical protein [Oscillospiraceae bacterium]
ANGFLSALSDSLSAISGFDVHWIRSLFCGLLEIGSAAACMRGLSPSPLNISLAAAILAWGGFSVHFQTLALISDTDIKGTLHFAGRLLGAVLSAVSAYVLTILLG